MALGSCADKQDEVEEFLTVPGVTCVFCEMIKLQYVLLRKGDDRRQLVLKCCGRELQGWLVVGVRD